MENTVTQECLFNLKFKTNLDETITITIPRADVHVAEPAVRAAMQGMIDSDSILTGDGSPTDIVSAQRITREIETFVA